MPTMNFEIENLLLSLGLPILLFLFQLYLRKKDSRIAYLNFIENKVLALSPAALCNMPGLDIQYQAKKISGNLIFYQFTITNSGALDIKNSNTPLKISLPSAFKWQSCNIYDKSPNLDINSQIKADKLQIVWDLLRRDEYVRFNTVIEYKHENKNHFEQENEIGKVGKYLIFSDTRIANLEVDKKNIKQYEIKLLNYKTLLDYILARVLSYTIITMFYPRAIYTVQVGDTEHDVELSLTSDSIYFSNQVDNIKFSYNNEIEIKDIKITKERKKEFEPYVSYFILILLNILLFILLEQNRMRKKRKKLGLYSRSKLWSLQIEDC